VVLQIQDMVDLVTVENARNAQILPKFVPF